MYRRVLYLWEFEPQTRARLRKVSPYNAYKLKRKVHVRWCIDKSEDRQNKVKVKRLRAKQKDR